MLVLCLRGVKLRKVGNPTVTLEQHKMTSSILRCISFLQRNMCHVLLWYMYMNVEKEQGLGLARLGLYTRVRVRDYGSS